jgi:hypothetical protein
MCRRPFAFLSWVLGSAVALPYSTVPFPR